MMNRSFMVWSLAMLPITSTASEDASDMARVLSDVRVQAAIGKTPISSVTNLRKGRFVIAYGDCTAMVSLHTTCGAPSQNGPPPCFSSLQFDVAADVVCD